MNRLFVTARREAELLLGLAGVGLEVQRRRLVLDVGQAASELRQGLLEDVNVLLVGVVMSGQEEALAGRVRTLGSLDVRLGDIADVDEDREGRRLDVLGAEELADLQASDQPSPPCAPRPSTC